ncbi:MAG: hypothetical protein WC516_06975 [Patescibacteria group bacterium]|jgi:4-hydroxy-3-methylbut-2-enyl diphosphate reductase IspH
MKVIHEEFTAVCKNCDLFSIAGGVHSENSLRLVAEVHSKNTGHDVLVTIEKNYVIEGKHD